MALQIGEKAPDFTLPTKTSEGFQPITLSESYGKKNTVILFFPMAFTGVCTTELCSVSQGLEAYASVNAVVLGISGDSPFSLDVWAQKEAIKIPLLSDYEHTVASAYGVAYESFLPQIGLPMGGVAKRSAFIVDKLGLIQYAEVHDDAHNLPDFAAISAKLAELK
jgi:glutaredoxin-dependent peroxiredoxin